MIADSQDCSATSQANMDAFHNVHSELFPNPSERIMAKRGVMHIDMQLGPSSLFIIVPRKFPSPRCCSGRSGPLPAYSSDT